jgi:hypothetical protein
MQEHLKQQKVNAPPTPLTGKVDIYAAREGLAMVMDGLRFMEKAGAKVSKASILFDGKICLLPVVEIHGYLLGISVMDDGSRTFTTNGVSVMEPMAVTDEKPITPAAESGKECNDG